MIEMRWVTWGLTNQPKLDRQLEYRWAVPSVDASGAFCPPVKWSRWTVVPTMEADEAALGDVVDSGGIQGAP
jgi:hypothetical protein